MKAGFASACVTPPVGCFMEGLGQQGPTTAIHDDLFIKMLYLNDSGREALIIGCDLLFFERKVIDRYKGAIGRVTNLAPHQILFNVSHNHGGPRLTGWAYGGEADPLYLDQVEAALLDGVAKARGNAEEVELFAGMTRTRVPVSRRTIDANGKAQWKPTFGAAVCDALPVVVFKTPAGKTRSVLFSVSCHPSMWYELQISADYPGVAQRLINEQFKTDGALFLQGAAGDTKPRQVADGETKWRHGKWEDVEAAGKEIADAVAALAKNGLKKVTPDLRCHYEETHWPMAELPTREKLVAIHNDPEAHRVMKPWAADMIQRLDRFGSLPKSVPIGFHAVQLARGVRMIALEGESVGELGLTTLACYSRGVTFPLGYTNGTQLYLPVSHMVNEEGYEVVSFYEYHWPAPLLPGGEKILENTIKRLQAGGVMPNDDV